MSILHLTNGPFYTEVTDDSSLILGRIEGSSLEVKKDELYLFLELIEQGANLLEEIRRELS